jgi:hypothetical protein
VVAGGVIDHRERFDLLWWLTIEGERAASLDASLLARPHLGATMTTERLNSLAFLEVQVEQHATVADPKPTGS